jgi:hypothetical protein
MPQGFRPYPLEPPGGQVPPVVETEAYPSVVACTQWIGAFPSNGWPAWACRIQRGATFRSRSQSIPRLVSTRFAGSATDSNDRLPSFSNFGGWIALSDPRMGFRGPRGGKTPLPKPRSGSPHMIVLHMIVLHMIGYYFMEEEQGLPAKAC